VRNSEAHYAIDTHACAWYPPVAAVQEVLLSRPQIVRHLPFAVIVSLALTFLPTRSFAQG
jgi:hypothetical protein